MWDPKPNEKLDSDLDTDPKKIIPGPQHGFLDLIDLYTSLPIC